LAAMAAGHVLGWAYAVAALVAVAIVLGFRLLAERARRRTLVALVTHSPTGTVVILEEGPGGPAMYLRVGDGPHHVSRAEAQVER
jgi:hypothetical protein